MKRWGQPYQFLWITALITAVALIACETRSVEDAPAPILPEDVERSFNVDVFPEIEHVTKASELNRYQVVIKKTDARLKVRIQILRAEAEEGERAEDFEPTRWEKLGVMESEQ